MPTIWGILTTGLKYYGYNIFTLSLRKSRLSNRYYRIFNIKLIFWEDILKNGVLLFSNAISNLETAMQIVKVI